jgi:very-short-patch-repair endonuclease
MEAIRIIKFKNYEIKRNLIENLPYNPKLKEFAKNLRKSRNLAEVLFWNEVKSKKFHSLDFDRQSY